MGKRVAACLVCRCAVLNLLGTQGFRAVADEDWTHESWPIWNTANYR